MATKIKHGSTFRMIMSDFTEVEWGAIYPHDFIEAEIGQGDDRTPTTIVADPDERIITITAETSHMRLGPAEMDIRVTKGYDTIIIPDSGVFKFLIVKTVTGTGA